jgi:putative endonuclease
LPHYLYILRSLRTGRLYVGATDDPERRLREHNRGWSKSTEAWRPWVLAHCESHPDVSAARRREWHLKCTPAGGKEKRSLAEAGGG